MGRRRYKMIENGSHREHDRVEPCKKGDVFESDAPLLDLFPKRFEEVHDLVPRPVAEKIRKKLETEERATQIAEDPAAAERDRFNVTANFPKAVSAGLFVFEEDGFYNVTDEPGGSPLNKDRMKKSEVNKFITEIVKER